VRGRKGRGEGREGEGREREETVGEGEHGMGLPLSEILNIHHCCEAGERKGEITCDGEPR